MKSAIDITDLTHEGRGVGRDGGQVCFVSGALPGETVTYKLERRRSQYIEARVDEILHPSAARREPFCRHFGSCGGCQVQHLGYPQQVALKQKQLRHSVERSGLVVEAWAEPEISAERAYRRRARLAVEYSREGVASVGFRAASSAQLVPVESCPVLVDSLNQLLGHLPAVLARMPVRIEEIELADEEGQLSLLMSGKAPRIEWNAQGEVPAANIYYRGGLGEVQQLAGCDNLSGAPGFMQANAAINQAMICRALDWLQCQPGERVLDAFCGAGNFSLPLARTGALVTGIEGDAGLLERARQLSSPLENVQYQALDLFDEEALRRYRSNLKGFNKVLLDPPRAGAEALVKELARARPSRILYISCHPATMVRDLKHLVAAGYRADQGGLFDMFPQTMHAEAMLSLYI